MRKEALPEILPPKRQRTDKVIFLFARWGRASCRKASADPDADLAEVQAGLHIAERLTDLIE
jgi:hypothetical protein